MLELQRFSCFDLGQHRSFHIAFKPRIRILQDHFQRSVLLLGIGAGAGSGNFGGIDGERVLAIHEHVLRSVFKFHFPGRIVTRIFESGIAVGIVRTDDQIVILLPHVDTVHEGGPGIGFRETGDQRPGPFRSVLICRPGFFPAGNEKDGDGGHHE